MQTTPRVLAGIAVGGLVLALILVLVLSGKPSRQPESSVAVQEVADPVVEEALRLLDESRATLAMVDSALNPPISASEREFIQGRVDNEIQDMVASGFKPGDPLEARKLAKRSLDIAQDALKRAREGKRQMTTKNFERSMIRMQAAKLALEPILTADQRRRLASIGLPPVTIDDSGSSSHKVLTIDGPEGEGGISLGRDGLRLEGTAGGREGAIKIGPEGIRIQGRRGKIEVTPDGVNLGADD